MRFYAVCQTGLWLRVAILGVELPVQAVPPIQKRLVGNVVP